MKVAGLVIAVVAAFGSPALADQCTAPLPTRGTQFAGVVRYVGDGDSLCVGKTSDPREWIEVRVADFYAPELNATGGRAAKASLEKIALGKETKCVAGRRSWDRVVAICTIQGFSIGDVMRRAGVREGGNR